MSADLLEDVDGCVILETSLGNLTIDLYTGACPRTTKNFLWLCKMKYYNDVLFHKIQHDFVAETGDPKGKGGSGGESAFGIIYGNEARFFEGEIHEEIKHTKKGIVAMSSGGKNRNGSQFYIQTTNRHLTSLDGKNTIFGEISEGLEILDKIATADVNDKTGRPLRNIRIRHTEVIENPFDDPKEELYQFPSRSPSPKRDKDDVEALEEDETYGEEDNRTDKQKEEDKKNERAKYSTKVLKVLGDLPHEDVKPPDNVLFVCKLNKETTDEDLETIFSQFGEIISAEVIRDWKTNESLNYAFIEFAEESQCEKAYLKMDNVLIDDRRIKVDFSQSVAKLWNRYKKGDRSMLQKSSSDYRPQAVQENVGRRRRNRDDDDDDDDDKKRRSTNLSFRSSGKLAPDTERPRSTKERHERSRSPPRRSSPRRSSPRRSPPRRSRHSPSRHSPSPKREKKKRKERRSGSRSPERKRRRERDRPRDRTKNREREDDRKRDRKKRDRRDDDRKRSSKRERERERPRNDRDRDRRSRRDDRR